MINGERMDDLASDISELENVGANITRLIHDTMENIVLLYITPILAHTVAAMY